VSDWNKELIGNLVEKVETWNPQNSNEIDFTYIDLSSVDQNTKTINRRNKFRCAEAPSRARQLVVKDDVLVSTVRPNLNAIAKVGESFDGATASTGFCILRSKKNILDSEYLYHWVRTEGFVSDMVKKATGASYPAVSDRIICESMIPLPPMPEQRRIAEILDKAEELRAKRRAALAHLDSITQAVFHDLIGDPVTNEMGWETDRVSELCELVRGSSPRPQGDTRYFGGPIPRLMIADITRDGWLVKPCIDSLTVEGAKRSRPVKAGTVVMAVSGNIGLVSRLSIDACVHDGFVAFCNLDELKCKSEYLLALLHYSKERHEKNKAGAIFINLTTTDIKSMQLPLPPIKTQVELFRRIDGIEKTKNTFRNSLAQLDSLFAVLQHRAFRGEL
jgi:restriction endonuclease S subunit